MNSAKVKNVLLAGLNGAVTQWSTDDGASWGDDKSIHDKISSAYFALGGERNFIIRVKPIRFSAGTACPEHK